MGASVLILIVLKEIVVNRQLPGPSGRVVTALACGALAVLAWDVSTSAQDRLKTMPGYAQYQKMSAQLGGAVRLAAVSGTWSADSSGFDYTFDGKRYRFDVASRSATETGAATDAAPAGRGGRGGGRGGTGIERGRQAASADAPDGKLKAFYRDRNLWVGDISGGNESAITSDGNDKDRIKYGTASWVYGEELAQTSAIWWSPDSRKVAYYRFDEKQVLDYNLQLDQTKIQSVNDVEAYPKAGAANPIVDLFVYDVATKKSTRVDVRGGKPFDDTVVGHYVYRVVVVAGRHRALVHPHQPAPERPRARRCQPRYRRDARHHPRGMADGLDREPSADAVPQRQPPLHLGVGAKRICQPLSLRPLRETHHAADGAHLLRSLGDRESGRSRGRDLLHGARRRQPHEGAAAPCRHRRQG